MTRKLDTIFTLDDFETAARRHLPRPVFGYIVGASETNASLNDNRDVFKEWGFVPRVLVGVEARSLKRTLFGHEYAAPFGIAPMGLCALSGYRGDISLAAAAHKANVPMIMSATSLIKMEDVFPHNPDAWFQAYLPTEPERIEALIDRVAATGFKTLVITVDTIISGNRDNIARTGFSTPLKPNLRLAWDGMIRPRWTIGTFLQTFLRFGMPYFENSTATRGAPILSKSVLRDFSNRDLLNWDHMRLIRKRWPHRLVLKGIMSAPDAVLARDMGADGVILSNHGGRQLDCTVSPMRVLAETVEALGGAIPVMIDSGFRRGSDVLKAIALGADFVFVGRPFNYASAVGGEAGVTRGIKIMIDELHRNLGLLGVNSLAEMGVDKLRRIA